MLADAEDRAAWDEMEDAWASVEQERLARLRVRAFALVCCDLVKAAHANLDAAVDRVLRARRDAEHALATLHKNLEQAERAALAAETDDMAWLYEVAARVQDTFG